MIPFDSWNKQFKNIFGAVKTETEIEFCVLVCKGENIQDPVMVIETDEGYTEYLAMSYKCDASESVNWYSVCYTPKKTGLYFYYFRFLTYYGDKYITRVTENSGETLDEIKGKWQLTVYDGNFKTPDWIKGGIIYQIFPDRFCKSGKVKGEIPSDRIIREDWGGQPCYKPNSENIITNNDYFGGNFQGVIKKLSYLKSMSVDCIYFNPIFEANSNHRYDTADFEKIDSLLGTEEDFKKLCREAKKMGIRVILDGVFSHTGADSKYFNKEKRYGDGGAYNNIHSPYYSWYKFNKWPDDYRCWWDILILPEIIEENEDYINYISGKDGILQKWQEAGASGYRLDVADELPDVFIEALRKSVKRTNPDALIIGEVWEDASNKISYGHRRQYFLGNQLDSVMNYPFYNAIVDYIRGGNANELNYTVMKIMENYPSEAVNTLMNHIGTHDTERILTLLGTGGTGNHDREWQAERIMTEAERSHAKKLLKMASAIQYMLPGVPSVYYGDEAGMEGFKDPFNRGCYPWGNEDKDLMEWYKKLGEIRKNSKSLAEGSYYSCYAEGGLYVFERKFGDEIIVCAVNRTQNDIEYTIGASDITLEVLIGPTNSSNITKIPKMSAIICKKLEIQSR